ncbi:MAG: hypothetical protein QM809_10870 [Gordonia sp. (in: high G+C Gram-positive bacteria)]|uniref:hypothetical protein n=1 Tax=Gordonia sp. (in: high G+C Gram-positive bacteria) TaxID=84139 RepID=UPI0039E37DE1
MSTSSGDADPAETTAADDTVEATENDAIESNAPESGEPDEAGDEDAADETVEPANAAAAAVRRTKIVPTKSLTQEERDAILVENRRVREEEAAKRAARDGEDDDLDEDDETAEGDDAEEEIDPSRVPGKVAAKPRARRKPGGRDQRTLVIGLAALAAVLAIATGVLGYLYASSSDGLGPDSELGRSALSDAKKYSAQIVTYSPEKYAALDKKIREVSTKDFADKYIKASQEARRGNDVAKASSVGTAVTAGLESLTETRAVVLVALDQKVTSPELPSAGEEGLEYQTRVKITLERDGDRWLVDELLTL